MVTVVDPGELAAHVDATELLDRLNALEAEAVIERQQIESLHRALETCRRIGAAVGILMATFKIVEDEAFLMLKRASQNGNRKLRDVADDVVLTGVLPNEGGRRACRAGETSRGLTVQAASRLTVEPGRDASGRLSGRHGLRLVGAARGSLSRCPAEFRGAARGRDTATSTGSCGRRGRRTR